MYVTDLQGALKALGVDGAEVPGFAEGQWDDATRAVLAKFQRDHALPVTGKADAETLKVLGGAIDTLNQVKNTLLELDADDVDLLLDLTQISLDIAGVAEPTGVADIASGLIGLSRGDWFGAGISFAGVLIPYAGDLAKLTKLQSWSNTVERFVSRAARDPAYAEKHQLVIQGLRKGLDSLPEAKLAKLPESVWTGIERLQSQIDTLLEAGLKTIPRDYGKNAVKWVVDEQGRLIKAEAILREVPEVARSGAEVRAQGRIARQFGQEGDNGGHVIANRFIGNQGDINIFPQHRDFNQSAYRVMENELADWVKAGAEVKFEVKFSGFDAKGRPMGVDIKYTAFNPKTGEKVYFNDQRFANAPGQTFERLSKQEIAQRMQASNGN